MDAKPLNRPLAQGETMSQASTPKPTGLEGQPLADTMNLRFKQIIEASERGMQSLINVINDSVKSERGPPLERAAVISSWHRFVMSACVTPCRVVPLPL